MSSHKSQLRKQDKPPPKFPDSAAQFDARPIGDQEVADSTPPGRQHSFVKIDQEIFSTVIPSLQLIQERQVLVCGKKICATPVNRLED